MSRAREHLALTTFAWSISGSVACTEEGSLGDACAQGDDTGFDGGDGDGDGTGDGDGDGSLNASPPGLGGGADEMPVDRVPPGWTRVTLEELLALRDHTSGPGEEMPADFVMFSRHGMFVQRSGFTDLVEDYDLIDVGDTGRYRVVGVDDREPITSPATLSSYPYRAVGEVTIGVAWENGNETGTATGRATGTLVGPRHVLTAAHALEVGPTNNLEDRIIAFQGIWNDTPGAYLRFTPGYLPSSENGQPNGNYRIVEAAVFSMSWLANSTDSNDTALIVLEDEKRTAELGWWAMCTASPEFLHEWSNFWTLGYPGGA